MKNDDGWIAVDFDGTLAHYDHFRGDDHFGKPIEPMVRRVRKWLLEGHQVKLLTARPPSSGLRQWMREHLGQILEITNKKDHQMKVLVDDRAINAERNTGAVDEAALKILLGKT